MNKVRAAVLPFFVTLAVCGHAAASTPMCEGATIRVRAFSYPIYQCLPPYEGDPTCVSDEPQVTHDIDVSWIVCLPL